MAYQEQFPLYFKNGHIFDIIVYGINNIVSGMPTITAIVMMIVQWLFNFLVGPGSAGQVMITMPIMNGLFDLLGVSRQKAVLVGAIFLVIAQLSVGDKVHVI